MGLISFRPDMGSELESILDLRLLRNVKLLFKGQTRLICDALKIGRFARRMVIHEKRALCVLGHK